MRISRAPTPSWRRANLSPAKAATCYAPCAPSTAPTTSTQGDIAQFEAQWMQPYMKFAAKRGAEYYLFARQDAAVWEINERMEAMVRMYDVTLDKHYLDYVHELIDIALKYRDDRHPGGKRDPTCTDDLHARTPRSRVITPGQGRRQGRA